MCATRQGVARGAVGSRADRAPAAAARQRRQPWSTPSPQPAIRRAAARRAASSVVTGVTFVTMPVVTVEGVRVTVVGVTLRFAVAVALAHVCVHRRRRRRGRDPVRVSGRRLGRLVVQSFAGARGAWPSRLVIFFSSSLSFSSSSRS